MRCVISFPLLFLRLYRRFLCTIRPPQLEQHQKPNDHRDGRDGQNGHEEDDVETVELNEAEVPRGDLEVVRAPSGGHELHEPRGVFERRMAAGPKQVCQPIDICPVFWVVPSGGRNVGDGFALMRPCAKATLFYSLIYNTVVCSI